MLKASRLCFFLLAISFCSAISSYADSIRDEILACLSDRHYTASEKIYQRWGERSNDELKSIALSEDISLFLRVRALATLRFSQKVDNNEFIAEIAGEKDIPLALRQESIDALAKKKEDSSVDQLLEEIYSREKDSNLRSFIVSTLRGRGTATSQEVLRRIMPNVGESRESGGSLLWKPFPPSEN